MMFCQGERYEGNWSNNKMNGEGVYYYLGDALYQGM